MLSAVSSDVVSMSSQRLFRRWWRQEPSTSLLASRTAIRPPATWGQADPVWKALWNWLRDSNEPELRRTTALAEARRDFGEGLADVIADDADDLRRRGLSARSLRELWHLRAELYSVVARHRSQAEADRRLALVNRHFPISTSPSTSATRPGQRQDT
jgi:hypothetical protein